MKFGIRNTSFVYPNGKGDIWEDTKVGEYTRVGADHLYLDFAGNDPESYELFVDEVMRNFV